MKIDFDNVAASLTVVLMPIAVGLLITHPISGWVVISIQAFCSGYYYRSRR